MCNKRITLFYLSPTHKPYLPLLPSRKVSPPFGRYSLRLHTKGWPGWVVLGGWLHTEINVLHWEVNPDTVTHLGTNRARCTLTSLIQTNHRCPDFLKCAQRYVKPASSSSILSHISCRQQHRVKGQVTGDVSEPDRAWRPAVFDRAPGWDCMSIWFASASNTFGSKQWATLLKSTDNKWWNNGNSNNDLTRGTWSSSLRPRRWILSSTVSGWVRR